MRRRHFCDCLAGLHWATICEAMRGNKKWQPRHGRHHAGADIERKDTCGLCQSYGRSYSSFVSQPKLKKHFKTAGSQTQISAGQTAINSICSKHEVSDLIFHSLQDAIQEVSNDYSTCAHVSLHKIFKENEQQDEQQKKPPTINPLKRFLHLANMLWWQVPQDCDLTFWTGSAGDNDCTAQNSGDGSRDDNSWQLHIRWFHDAIPFARVPKP